MSSAPQPATQAEINTAAKAFYAQLSAEPQFSHVPSSFAPSPSPGPATPKVVPPHPVSPPAAPPAKRQKSGAHEALPEAPLSGSQEPSVFNVLNVFRRRWFLHRDHLIANVLSTTKDDAGLLDWVDFQPPFHTHLVRKAVSLLPPLCPMAKGKRAMFVFILEVLNEDG